MLESGRLQNAIEQHERAIQIRPDYEEAHNELAFALLQAGKVNEAMQQWETTLRLDPSNQDAQRELERDTQIRWSGAPTP